MASGQRVLVVDGLSETEEVLRAVLEPRGLIVDRVRGYQNDHKPPGNGSPHVVVLHDGDTEAAHTRLESWSDVPRVIIGSAHIPAPLGTSHSACDQYLQKPFQYGELIQAIERLLDGLPG